MSGEKNSVILLLKKITIMKNQSLVLLICKFKSRTRVVYLSASQ